MKSYLQRRSHLWYHLAIVVLLLLTVIPATAAFRHLTEGMEVPDFEGEAINTGQKIKFSEMIKDNMVIVVFWSTWSPRSLTELSDLKDILTKYKDHPIRVIAINVDAPKLTAAGRASVDKVVTDLELPFDVLIDDGLKIFYSYGVIAVPSTAVVDTNGVLRYGPSGYSLATRDIVVDSIEMFLGLSEPDTVMTFFARYRPTRRATRYYNMAVNLKGLGLYERALAILDSAEVSDSNFAAVRSLRGEVLLRLDQPAEAALEFEAGVGLDSMAVPTWAGWGRALMRSGEIERAKKKLIKSLELEDTYTPALMDLGLCWAETDSVDHAIKFLESAVELNRMDMRINHVLGRLYHQAGRQSDAIKSYLTALSVRYPAD